ncbi:unnamed protein product [Cylicocyclus nassatus]|uniref:Uncharacterized protein n=1 Tax=Cylicocyclus nassatus TaxID=53992 RepID=A0AA36GTX1_CYLNA|nr:unnamed protein product [Cylicocyclus nassatus]
MRILKIREVFGIQQMFREEDVQMSSLPVINASGFNGLMVSPASILNGARESNDAGDTDRQCSTDRSISATPSQSGDDQHQDLDDDPMSGMMVNGSAGDSTSQQQNLSLSQEVAELKNNFVYISHQMTRIMRSLHVTPCMCETCGPKHNSLNDTRPKEEVSNVLSAIFPGATPQQLSGLADLTKLNRTPVPAPQRMGAGYAGHPGGGKLPAAAAADRRAVAEYARAYGGAAAAKRFGIAPPVSTYYQRKDSGNTLLAGAMTASPGPSSEGEGDGGNQMQNNPENNVPTPSQIAPASIPNNPMAALQQQPPTPSALPTSQPQAQAAAAAAVAAATGSGPAAPGQAATPGMFTPAMVDMLRMNAAHATGSPGFLRGRGRGRPKLIGDELDADLVDYMVTVKQADPHGHLTASQALIIAKQYILEKAPGLLEEHGGHVKLKLTWAMKLVSRIAERQKEMELGLPAGSLSNLGRHQLNSLNTSLTGGGFMADMMTQNILSHHMMMNMNNQVKQEPPAPVEEPKEDLQPAVGAPEILSIKELNLPFLNNLFGCSDENSGVIEGELPADNDQEMNLAGTATSN